MSKPYSDDLRIRVLKAVDNGEKMCLTAKNFSISEKTIYLWRKHREERGHIKPIVKYQKGHSHKIKDLEKFKEFATTNSSLTAKEMAQAWKGVGATTIKTALRKIGFTRKKRLTGIVTDAKKSGSFILIN